MIYGLNTIINNVQVPQMQIVKYLGLNLETSHHKEENTSRNQNKKNTVVDKQKITSTYENKILVHKLIINFIWT